MGFFVGNAIITEDRVQQQKPKKSPPSFAEIKAAHSSTSQPNQKPKRDNKTSAYMQDLMNK